jgi:hypothetical protein
MIYNQEGGKLLALWNIPNISKYLILSYIPMILMTRWDTLPTPWNLVRIFYEKGSNLPAS